MSIKKGTSLPHFELKDQHGNTFSSKVVKGKQAVVIYFYPKNFTPECTKEACSFRDSFEDFTAENILVIGISGDSEKSHQKFASKFNLPFTLLADSKKKVRRLFGVKNDLLGLLPGRETFVFDANGILVSKFKSMNAKPHIEGALRQLKKKSIMKSELHLLKFKPILKEKVWGGIKLKEHFNKNAEGNIGESWELSGVDENVSVVADGGLKGNSLNDLIKTYGATLMGEKVYKHYGNKFPLLFKFIDATEDLSVQLHPDDSLAQARHNSFGKTEMWYIMDAEDNARLIVGFKEGTTKEVYEKHISENKITDILISETVTEGDSYFIAPGTVHAIGAGVVLAEIQQTSDITYRIYDWDRPGLDGKMRDLHTDEAIEAINYNVVDAKLSVSEEKNRAVLLKKSDFFETNKLVLSEDTERHLKSKDSFVVYMCVAGDASIIANNYTESIKTGETILVPHSLADVTIKTQSATLLEVYIP